MTDTTAADTTNSPEIHPLEQQRRENREAIAALGVAPYGKKVEGLMSLAEARDLYDESADLANQESEAARKQAVKAGVSEGELPSVVDERARVKVSGRVVLKRGQGKLFWLQIRDHSTASSQLIHGIEADAESGTEARERSAFASAVVPDLQLAVSKRDVDEVGFGIAKQLDLGDIVVAEGKLMKTKMGEITVWVDRLEMASKSIAPPPEKWSGLQDVEARYRRRYIDLYANPESLQVMKCRSMIVRAMRSVLEDREFLEVDTPVLQTLAGGAAARPFLTHMNALDMQLFMRIAPELFLKRCMVGGLNRVFEFSRNFRNEGLSPRHNPEFTSLEVYQAFGDYDSMAELTEAMLRAAATSVAAFLGKAAGDLSLAWGDGVIDWGQPFRRVTFSSLFEEALGFSFTDVEACSAEAAKRGLKVSGADGVALAPILIANGLFEEVAEPTIDPLVPTFVYDYPSALSPLTRPRSDEPMLAERWDLFVGGMEIGPAYTELNDPDVQESKFREQLAGVDDEESTFRTFDADFVNALKVGMPPAGGLGLGIDRIVMLLTNQRSIRDVVLFPFMRPEA